MRSHRLDHELVLADQPRNVRNAADAYASAIRSNGKVGGAGVLPLGDSEQRFDLVQRCTQLLRLPVLCRRAAREKVERERFSIHIGRTTYKVRAPFESLVRVARVVDELVGFVLAPAHARAVALELGVDVRRARGEVGRDDADAVKFAVGVGAVRREEAAMKVGGALNELVELLHELLVLRGQARVRRLERDERRRRLHGLRRGGERQRARLLLLLLLRLLRERTEKPATRRRAKESTARRRAEEPAARRRGRGRAE